MEESPSEKREDSGKPGSSGSLEEKAKKLGVPFLADSPKRIGKETLLFIPEDVARKYRMAVFEKKKDALRVAMVNPDDFEALNLLRFLAEKEQLNMQIHLVSEEAFEEIVKQYSGADKALKEAMQSLKGDGDDSGVSLVSDESAKAAAEADQEVIQDAPIARLVEAIVKHSIEARASDIHIEPSEGGYRVRFRIDGILHSSLVFPTQVGKAVVARIKILSNLKIDERRKPQDGRFRAESGGKTVDLRISTLPIVDGEKVVMRVLDKGESVVDFKEMGLWGRNQEVLKRKIMEPYGIILVTGPTGSGKSTTLYAFLQILNREERNIITLEDPVEFSIPGINQSQVHPDIGYTFASGLRSILRQDPNVIMVGEIRDGETAELAIHAALTGHLVLSTLHTNSSIGAIPRLIDMGIEPFLLSSSIQAVAAQRLVRRICPECKEPDSIPPETHARVESELKGLPSDEVGKYGYEPGKKPKFSKGAGCDSCGNSGYRGRMAIYEVFEVTPEVKRIIADEGGSEAKLIVEGEKQKMLSMRQDAILKAAQGLTTLAEVERVTGGVLLIDEE